MSNTDRQPSDDSAQPLQDAGNDPQVAAEDGTACQSASQTESAQAAEAVTVQAQWRQDLAAARDRELRAQAELENFRKRMYRQMEDERKYAALPLASDLLPVVDNLARAIQAAEKSANSSGLLEGVGLVLQQLQRVLDTHGCKPIAAQGQPFDPRVHQAIGHQPSDQHAVGVVTEEAQVGYQLAERVIRPSLVLVSAGPAAAPSAD